MRQIKLGLKYEYPMCCILWFETGYRCMRSKGGPLSGPINCWQWDACNDRIMCPECLLKYLVRSMIYYLMWRCN